MPDRSLYIFGYQMGLCARCFSFYTTLAFTVFLLAFFNKLEKYWKLGLLLSTPLLIDGLTQISGLRTSTNFLRIITGIFAGIGIALVLRKIIWVLCGRIIIPFFKRLNIWKEYLFEPYFIVFIIIFSSMLFSYDQWAYSETERETILKQYTPVILVLRENVSSKDKKPGDKVQLVVFEDIIIDGRVLIKHGSPVMGTLSIVREAASLGEPGEIAIVPQYVEAIDGQKVRLGGTLYARGKDKEVSTAVLTAICLPFALRGGGQATVTDGTELKAYVEKDYKINTAK